MHVSSRFFLRMVKGPLYLKRLVKVANCTPYIECLGFNLFITLDPGCQTNR